MNESGRSETRDLGELVIPVLVVVATAAYLWDVREIPRPGENLLLVRPLSIIVVLLAAYLVVGTLGSWRRASATKESKTNVFDRNALLWVGTFFAYLVALSRFGFLIVTPVYLAFWLYVLGTRSWRTGIGTVCGVTIGCYLVFELLLNVRLP